MKLFLNSLVFNFFVMKNKSRHFRLNFDLGAKKIIKSSSGFIKNFASLCKDYEKGMKWTRFRKKFVCYILFSLSRHFGSIAYYSFPYSA